jgi:hypothetical protein
MAVVTHKLDWKADMIELSSKFLDYCAVDIIMSIIRVYVSLCLRSPPTILFDSGGLWYVVIPQFMNCKQPPLFEK